VHVTLRADLDCVHPGAPEVTPLSPSQAASRKELARLAISSTLPGGVEMDKRTPDLHSFLHFLTS
jgi:hypothetical protein